MCTITRSWSARTGNPSPHRRRTTLSDAGGPLLVGAVATLSRSAGDLLPSPLGRCHSQTSSGKPEDGPSPKPTWTGGQCKSPKKRCFPSRTSPSPARNGRTSAPPSTKPPKPGFGAECAGQPVHKEHRRRAGRPAGAGLEVPQRGEVGPAGCNAGVGAVHLQP